MLGLSEDATGTVLAAAVAGGASFLLSILSKEQKTSEFRQAWVDALRFEVAASVAALNTACSYEVRGDRGPDWTAAKDAFFHQSALIRLRLNPDEKRSVVLFTALDRVAAFFANGDPAGARAEQVQIVGAAQLILSAEWKRVKRGELAFTITKYCSLATFVVGALWLFARYWPAVGPS
jgi:hypothetical protein